MIPASEIASTIPGKDIIISEILIIISSTIPPKYPESIPKVVPIVKIEITSTNDAVRDILVP